MYAYRLETVVPQNGELQLKSLPFRPGETIEVIILAANTLKNKLTHFPLKNSVLLYENPLEPVAVEDWSILQ
jgi:hypothetical protein